MKITTNMALQVSADRAWYVFAEKFGDIGQLISALKSSELEGQLGNGVVRSCVTSGFGPFPPSEIKEHMIAFEPESKSFTYVVKSGLPVMVKKASNQWTIESTGKNSCTVHSHAEIELSIWVWPLRWLFPILMKRDIEKTFEEMRYYIEKDEIHPRKMKILGQNEYG